jgi:hypothetical protein
MCSYTHSLTSVLDGGEWSASRPGSFTSKERAPGIHWIGGRVGPRAVLDAAVKRKIPSPLRESNPRTPVVQPVAQCYTDWTITALAVPIELQNSERHPSQQAINHSPNDAKTLQLAYFVTSFIPWSPVLLLWGRVTSASNTRSAFYRFP